MNLSNLFKFGKTTWWMLLIGMAVGGCSWALSESSWWDDHTKYSDELFWGFINPACTIGMIAGGIIAAIAILVIIREFVSGGGSES